MSDIKELYITLQKYFWFCESDLDSRLKIAKSNLLNLKPDADIMLRPICLIAERDMLNKIQHDINKLLEVYLHE